MRLASRHLKTAAQADAASRFDPPESGLPPLPAVDWGAIGAEPPTLLASPTDDLPEADAVVITWAEAEWAALHHVFVDSASAMSHDQSEHDDWPQWQRYDKDMPYYRGSDSESWTYWGLYCLVEIGSRKVLLFKSNTHLDWPGERYLEDLIERIAEVVRPSLLFSIGTAGGARTTDHLGTVNVVNAGTLYDAHDPASDWPTYGNGYTPDWRVVGGDGFASLLVPVPATTERLQALADAFNAHYGTSYPLSELNPGDVNDPEDPVPLNDLAPDVSLLTTATFVVGTNDGQYADYAVIEMDDAVIGEVCDREKVAFGFVRNVSDPVQNAALPEEVQGNWGSAVYETYGLYTRVNGALGPWALRAAGAGCATARWRHRSASARARNAST